MPPTDPGVEFLLKLAFAFGVLCVVAGFWFGVSAGVQEWRRGSTRSPFDRNELVVLFFLLAGGQGISSLANFSGLSPGAVAALSFQLGFWATGMGLLARRRGGRLWSLKRWLVPSGVSESPRLVWSAAGSMVAFGSLLFAHSMVSQPDSILAPWLGQNAVVVAMAVLMGLRTRHGWVTAVMWPVALGGLYFVGLEYGWWGAG